MDITQASTSRGGEKEEVGNRLLAKSPEDLPGRIFRDTLYLRFGPVIFGEELIIDPVATTLKANFSSYKYDALSVNETALRAKIESFSSGGVKVILDAPRRVISVSVNPLKIPDLGYVLEFYRIDGLALSEAPTAISIGQPVTFLREKQAQDSMGLFVPPSHEVTLETKSNKVHGARGIEGHSVPASFLVDFTDSQFVIRLKRLNGAYVSITPNDITEVKIHSYPTGPRLGIAYPVDPIQGNLINPSEAIFFWQYTGEIGTTVQQGFGLVDAGEALAAELELGIPRLLERRRELFQGKVLTEEQFFFDVALVLESDAPCRFRTTTFNISYLYARDSWSNGELKQVLHFNGQQVTSQQISFQLPSAAVVASATLVASESFHGPQAQLENGGPEFFQALIEQDTGSKITNTCWVAQSFTHFEMRSISGIALGLLPITEEAQLQIEIREDFQGYPNGRKLLSETLRLGQPGRRNWSILWFKESIAISTQPHWLLLTTLSGQALWLTQEGTSQICILGKSDQPTIETKLATFRNITTFHRLFVSASKNHRALPQVSLSIGGQIVPPIALQNNAYVYDLTNSLETYFGSHTSELTPMVPLCFSAMASGTVVVYPPHIEYDLR